MHRRRHAEQEGKQGISRASQGSTDRPPVQTEFERVRFGPATPAHSQTTAWPGWLAGLADQRLDAQCIHWITDVRAPRLTQGNAGWVVNRVDRIGSSTRDTRTPRPQSMSHSMLAPLHHDTVAAVNREVHSPRRRPLSCRPPITLLVATLYCHCAARHSDHLCIPCLCLCACGLCANCIGYWNDWNLTCPAPGT